MNHWMYNGYTDTYTNDYGTYNSLLGEQKTSFSQKLNTSSCEYIFLYFL